jgi:hypothetical protein
MDLNQSIREVVPWVVGNYGYSSDSAGKCREVLHKLILELEAKELSTQRLYLEYFLIESVAHQEEEETLRFFSSLFPIPMKKSISAFIRRLVSLAVCLSNRQVLTASSVYLEKEQIKLPEDIEELPLNLAEKSPAFAAVLLDKGVFNATKPELVSKARDLYSPELLTQWLTDLNKLPESDTLTFNGQALIRYSLLGQGQHQSQLHMNILQAIERRRLQPLSNQFIIDMATQLSHRKEQLSSTEKFAQVLVVGAQNGICNTLLSSNQMKNNLVSLFPGNFLIKAIVSVNR